MKFNLYAYDAYFLDCAESLRSPLLTLDLGMQRVAREIGITILEQDIMKVYTYSVARQRLAEVLNLARSEEVVIKRRGGETFSIIFRKSNKSPFDVPGIQTKATIKDILAAVEESRQRFAEQDNED